MTNPYIAYTLLINAGLDGIRRNLKPGIPENINLFTAEKAVTDKLKALPYSLDQAVSIAKSSSWLKRILPACYFEFDNI